MRRHALLLVAGLLATAGAACTPSTVAPTGKPNPLLQLTETLNTEHFQFHYSPGDRVEAERSEAYVRWLVTYLGATYPARITYYKFRTVEDYYQFSPPGSIGMANMSAGTVYTYENWQPHEVFHVYTGMFGRPPALFREGAAYAHVIDPYNNDYQPRASSAPGSGLLIDAMRAVKAQGLYVPLSNMLYSLTPIGVAKYESGSFVRYLVDTRGVEKLKQVFSTISYSDTRDVVLRKFKDIYGVEMVAAEKEWLAYLDSGH